MLNKSEFPIMEFDTAKEAKLNPSTWAWKQFGADKMIITFFPEVMKKLIAANEIECNTEIGGENPFSVYRFTKDPEVLIVLGQVGCPSCAGNLDLYNAMGVKKVMFCGGGGVLDKNIKPGEILVVDGAIRDEGFSYHYLPPARVVYTKEKTRDAIVKYMEEHKVPHLRGLCWTTDAIFRETADKVVQRREEGAKIVEMEQAGCLAVAEFRGFDYGALIYGGDDVASDVWDSRGWNSREGIRYNLVMLCKELVREI